MIINDASKEKPVEDIIITKDTTYDQKAMLGVLDRLDEKLNKIGVELYVTINDKEEYKIEVFRKKITRNRKSSSKKGLLDYSNVFPKN